jgi:hypothetical protein
MSFRPSENEERYFAQLEIERRRADEERRANTARPADQAGSGQTSCLPDSKGRGTN